MARLSNQIMTDNIEGFPGYHVTKTGKVYSLKSGSYKLMKTRLHHRTGREIVHLKNCGKSWNAKVYRLVALAYIPNPANKPFVCHKDNNILNNTVDNLYWGTAKENQEQMARDGRSNKGKHYEDFPNRKRPHPKPGIKGLDNPTFRLSKEQFLILCKPLSTIEKRNLSKDWGISIRCINRYISKIKTGYYVTSK